MNNEGFGGMNDLGVPALGHWEMFNCDDSQPGDWAVDEVSDVNCPTCLARFEKMRKERRSMLKEVNREVA